MSDSAPRDVHAHVRGPFGAGARRRLDRAVDGWCVSNARSGIAHVDLSAATGLDVDGAAFLAEVHRRLVQAGWGFRITPPDDATARATFIGAAVSGVFGWASAMRPSPEGLDNDESA